MTEPGQGGRTFSDQEVGLILKRAAELQQRGPTGGMSAAELEQAALEAGIEPRHVRNAISELDHRDRSEPSGFLGYPTRIEFEQTLEGELPASEYPALVEEIRRSLARTGSVATLGGNLEWTDSVPGGRQLYSISVSPRRGETRVAVEGGLSQEAGGLFGGLMGGLGSASVMLGFGLGLGELHSVAIALLLASTGLLCSYGLARTLFGAVYRRRLARLSRLIKRLTGQVEEAIQRQADQLESEPPNHQPLHPGRIAKELPSG